MIPRIRIGIDPGIDGFIAVNKDGKWEFHPMPKKVFGHYKNVVDGELLANILYPYLKYIDFNPEAIKIFVEEVHAVPNSSAAANFSFGHNVGSLHGALNAEGMEIILVQPKRWQKKIWIPNDIVMVPSKSGKTMVKDTKATSINACKRLYPEINLKRTSRCTTDHDGKADSLLICTYGMLTDQ